MPTNLTKNNSLPCAHADVAERLLSSEAALAFRISFSRSRLCRAHLALWAWSILTLKIDSVVQDSDLYFTPSSSFVAVAAAAVAVQHCSFSAVQYCNPSDSAFVLD